MCEKEYLMQTVANTLNQFLKPIGQKILESSLFLFTIEDVYE